MHDGSPRRPVNGKGKAVMQKSVARFAGILLTCACVVSLTACGGGGGGGAPGAQIIKPPPPPPPETTDNLLSGSVGDGPVINSRVRVYDDQGNIVGDVRSDATATYTGLVNVEDVRYPLLIESRGGTDLVTGAAPDFGLISVAMHAAPRTISNINPHSTLIVETALRAGPGPTDNTLASARTTVLEQLNFGLDRRQIGDPVTSPIDADNIAVMVKSSEALGEMVRRTRDALIGTGVADGDAVVGALAADLVDGLADGRGSVDANTRIAAVSHLASAQVLLEALVNELRVNGVVATTAMDNAIMRIAPASPTLTDSVASTADMLAQTVVALDAAFAFTGDPVIESAAAAVRDLPADILPADVRGRLPADAGIALQAAIDAAAVAGDAELDVIIRAVRDADAAQSGTPKLSFDVASATVFEGSTLEITIRRDSGAGEASFEWRTRSDSATGGEDFRGRPWQVVSLAAGQYSKTVSIETFADGLTEDDEYFYLELGSPTGVELGSPATVRITLLDAAPTDAGVFTLSADRTTVNEGETVRLTIRRSAGDVPATVSWETVNGSATAPGDFGGVTARTLSFAAGETSKTVSVATVDDGVAEATESFVVRLLSPAGGATLGTPADVTIALLDVNGDPVPGDGTATLSWTPPTERVDGSVLDNLAGYEVHYGQDETRMDRTIVLDNPGLTSFVVEGLGQGTWYFGMKAFDAEGRRSALSTLGSKSFP
jgi:hypothetical protein